MPLIRDVYGKGRVRVMRVKRDTKRHEVRELTVKVMLEGAFAAAFTVADNSRVISTDTIKNVVNVVAHENIGAANEPFCEAAARRFLDQYAQVERVTVTAHETKWLRLSVGGAQHPHGFVLDGNGKPFAEVTGTRGSLSTRSGIDGFTFLKSTGSGWEHYFVDEYTTLAPTDDRICATSMNAAWAWSAQPKDYVAANKTLLDAMLDVFAGTYSNSVQDSLYRMGEAALAAIPQISEISLACPNKHYILMNLKPFGIENQNQVFLPTDEPHGQIECTVAR
jgi:urate oxidase